MSVLIETSAGDLVIDLFTEKAPKTCLNFLKLCKIKYYNFSLFDNIRHNYTCQSGDPHEDGGKSIWALLGDGDESKRYFVPEIDEDLRHDQKGIVSMVTIPDSTGQNRLAGSQFLITLTDSASNLDEKAAILGTVVEGLDTLDAINNALCDDKGRPLRDIRIKHTYILEDMFDDPEGLIEPSESPEPTEDQLKSVRIGENEEIPADIEQDEDTKRADQRARQQALTLEMVGDLPFAEVRPKENQLFVCKLNPATEEEDLELIFSRFGKIVSCSIVKDKRTGDSLQYGFIDFEKREDCERAYFKMEGVLIDDRRIHVDFSQSVAKMNARVYKGEISGGGSRRRDWKGQERDGPREERYRSYEESGDSRKRFRDRGGDGKYGGYDRHDEDRDYERSDRHDSYRHDRYRDSDRENTSDRNEGRDRNDRPGRYNRLGHYDRYDERGGYDSRSDHDRYDRYDRHSKHNNYDSHDDNNGTDSNYKTDVNHNTEYKEYSSDTAKKRTNKYSTEYKDHKYKPYDRYDRNDRYDKADKYDRTSRKDG